MAAQSNGNLISATVASVSRRWRVLLGGAVLVGLGWVGSAVWRVSQAPLRTHADFQITAAAVDTTPPPPWVRVDIREQAIERATLQGPLSVIDAQQAVARIAEAFRHEPWVRKVDKVELQPPNRARVELQWRRPLAVVAVESPAGVSLTPIDAESVRVPTAGLKDGELRRMPRITGVRGAPPTGEAWVDPQVNDAVSLINAMGDNWARLSLADIAPLGQPQIRGDLHYYQFEVITIGGTRIFWGAAPGVPTEEPAFAAKLATLQRFVSGNHVQLDGYNSPEIIDLRRGLDTTKRIAKKKDGKRTAQAETGSGDEVVK